MLALLNIYLTLVYPSICHPNPEIIDSIGSSIPLWLLASCFHEDVLIYLTHSEMMRDNVQRCTYLLQM